MTVEDLRDFLENCDDNAKVFICQDNAFEAVEARAITDVRNSTSCASGVYIEH